MTPASGWRGLAAVLLAVGGLLAPPSALSASALPRTTTHPAAVTSTTPVLTVESMSPAVLTRSDTLTVTGTLTAGATALTAPVVRLVRGKSAISSRDDVSTWALGTDAAGGEVAASQTLSAVAAGARVSYRLTVPARGITSRAAWSVLPLAVEVTDTGTSPETSLHTFVGWWDHKEYEPLSVAVVAPLTLPADPNLLSTSDTTRAAAWRAQLAPTGHLRRVLDGLDVPGLDVTLAVDPAILGRRAASTSSTSTPSTSSPTSPATSSPATTAPTPDPTSSTSTSGSTGSSGSSGSSSRSTDPVASLVAPLAARLVAASTAPASATTTHHDLWSLPYGDTDLAAVADLAGQSPSSTTAANPAAQAAMATVTAQVADGAGLSSLLSGAKVVSGVAWPVDGSLTTAREAALRTLYTASGSTSGSTGSTSASLRAALVSGSTIPTASAGFSPTAPHASPGGLPVLGWDDTMSALTLRTSTVAAGALATQELVAQTATYLGESPGVARSLLIAVPRSVDPQPAALRTLLATLTRIPWVTPTAATTLLTSAAGADRVASLQASTWTAPSPVLTSSVLSGISTARGTIGTVASVLPQAMATSLGWEDALAQLTSARWRTRPQAVGALLTAGRAWAGQATFGIRVVSQDTNFLADEGILQVTVVNDLDSAVSGLRLVLGPTNPRLRVVAQPAPVTIAAHSRQTVNVTVRAVAAGLVPVTAALTTSNGTPIGSPAELRVRANPPGRAFYLISGGAVGLILVAGIFRTLRRRRATRPAVIRKP